MRSKFVIAVVLLALSSVGCTAMTFSRNARTYRAEVDVALANNLEASVHLLEFAKTSSVTDRAKCKRVAGLGLVLGFRSKWHASMQLYLAGLEDQKPSLPPKVPSVSTICGSE